MQDEAKDAFKELLVHVNCNSDWTWEQTLRLIIADPRCKLCIPSPLLVMRALHVKLCTHRPRPQHAAPSLLAGHDWRKAPIFSTCLGVFTTCRHEAFEGHQLQVPNTTLELGSNTDHV